MTDVETKFQDPNKNKMNQEKKSEIFSFKKKVCVEETLSELDDVILYLIDTVSTICVFIDSCFDANIMFNNEIFLNR